MGRLLKFGSLLPAWRKGSAKLELGTNSQSLMHKIPKVIHPDADSGMEKGLYNQSPKH